MKHCSRLLHILAGIAVGMAAAPAGADERLAERIGCADCHAATRKGTGPAYADIAARYRGQAGAADALVRVIRQGGKGNWTAVTGGVAMPPYSALLTDAESRRLADWVLSH